MSAPRAVYLTSATVYPFLLLTAITSLALNLSYARQSNHQKTQALTAQITVLSDILTTLAATPLPPSGPLRAAQLDAIDKNLQMVGLREGAAAPVVDPTTWREVLLGKKGKQFTDNDEAEPDWATSTSSQLVPKRRRLTQFSSCSLQRSYRSGSTSPRAIYRSSVLPAASSTTYARTSHDS